ncbi:MAG: hypothetical protein K9I26_06940 [Flavobacterium sp.]|nr:hypothetical protein [Flavobacterium sp.]
MNLKKYKPILEIGFLSLLIYSLHKLFFYLNQSNPKFSNLYFSTEVVYSFFFVCSIIIIFGLIQVKEKNIDSVGFAFLWLTCIKMGVSYAFFFPLLLSENTNSSAEKTNFLIVFLFFLAIETLTTVRILNNKQ